MKISINQIDSIFFFWIPIRNQEVWMKNKNKKPETDNQFQTGKKSQITLFDYRWYIQWIFILYNDFIYYYTNITISSPYIKLYCPIIIWCQFQIQNNLQFTLVHFQIIEYHLIDCWILLVFFPSFLFLFIYMYKIIIVIYIHAYRIQTL